MKGDGRAPADEKVLGFSDTTRAHFHSPARRAIVTKVTRDGDECKSWYGKTNSAQCFDIASENAMTLMIFFYSPVFAMSVSVDRV